MNPTIPTHHLPTSTGTIQPPQKLFRRFSTAVAAATGSPWAFVVASAAVIVWAALGHHYHYSDTWQLVINTGTTIVTFLMVFLIQNTQNRDARAIQLKLDELIRASEGPRNRLINLENCSDEEIARLEHQFQRFREHALRGKHSQETGSLK